MVNGSSYSATNGTTYINFKNALNQAIVVPLTYSNGDTVINAKLIKVEGACVLTYDGLNASGLATKVDVDLKVDKTELSVTKATNLILSTV